MKNNLTTKKRDTVTRAEFIYSLSCIQLCNSYSLPGFSVHENSQARILECVAISFSRGSSDSGITRTSSALAGEFFIAEPPRKTKSQLCTCKYSKDLRRGTQTYICTLMFIAPLFTKVKGGKTQVMINKLIDTQIVLHTYYGIFFIHK